MANFEEQQENEKLRKEIEYLSALIRHHKSVNAATEPGDARKNICEQHLPTTTRPNIAASTKHPMSRLLPQNNGEGTKQITTCKNITGDEKNVSKKKALDPPKNLRSKAPHVLPTRKDSKYKWTAKHNIAKHTSDDPRLQEINAPSNLREQGITISCHKSSGTRNIQMKNEKLPSTSRCWKEGEHYANKLQHSSDFPSKSRNGVLKCKNDKDGTYSVKKDTSKNREVIQSSNNNAKMQKRLVVGNLKHKTTDTSVLAKPTCCSNKDGDTHSQKSRVPYQSVTFNKKVQQPEKSKQDKRTTQFSNSAHAACQLPKQAISANQRSAGNKYKFVRKNSAPKPNAEQESSSNQRQQPISPIVRLSVTTGLDGHADISSPDPEKLNHLTSTPVDTVSISKYKYVKSKPRIKLPPSVTYSLIKEHSPQYKHATSNHKGHKNTRYKFVRSNSARGGKSIKTPNQQTCAHASSEKSCKVISKFKLMKVHHSPESVSSSYRFQSSQKLVKKAVAQVQKFYLGRTQQRSQSSSSSAKNQGYKGKGWKKRYSLSRQRKKKQGDSSYDVNKLLGRNVLNASKNKYKFINGHEKQPLNKFHVKKAPTSIYSSQRQKKIHVIPSSSKLKLDHRRKYRSSTRRQDQRSGLVNISGVIYKTSRNHLRRTPQTQFSKDNSGKSSLKTQGKYRLVRPAVQVSSSTQLIASQALRWSRRVAATAQLRKQQPSPRKAQKLDCLFFNRFGKCNRGASCPYQHDPEKVAVCTRFLRGRCKVSNCPFSHKVAKEKMPVCSYFLKGVCNREDCPYLHVNVGRNASICHDFAQGFCAMGDKCKKKHVTACQEFQQTGKCSAGDKCPLKHRHRQLKRKRMDSTKCGNSSQNEPGSAQRPIKRQRRQTTEENETLGTKPEVDEEPNKLPSFIALEFSSPKEETPEVIPATPVPMKPQISIYPSFLQKK